MNYTVITEWTPNTIHLLKQMNQRCVIQTGCIIFDDISDEHLALLTLSGAKCKEHDYTFMGAAYYKDKCRWFLGQFNDRHLALEVKPKEPGLYKAMLSLTIGQETEDDSVIVDMRYNGKNWNYPDDSKYQYVSYLFEKY